MPLKGSLDLLLTEREALKRALESVDFVAGLGKVLAAEEADWQRRVQNEALSVSAGNDALTQLKKITECAARAKQCGEIEGILRKAVSR